MGFWGAVERRKSESLREIEGMFLINMMLFQQKKFHALQVLEIIYDKAGELDPQFKKDYEKIKLTTENKFDEICNEMIASLQKSVGYQLEYSSIQEAMKFVDKNLRNHKK
jgi:hypothetical protein